MKKLYSFIAVMLIAAMLCACGTNAKPDTSEPATSGPASGEIAYSVTVTDPAGKPVTEGVIVSFMSGSDVAAMVMPNADGVAEKVLPKGEYTVTLGFTSSMSYHYTPNELNLTAEQPALSITLAASATEEVKTYNVYDAVTGEESTYSEYFYHAFTGCTYVPVKNDGMTYVYFTPTVSGLYRFSVVGGTADLGYYGSPHFIQQNTLVEPDAEGGITVNITNGMIGTNGTGTSTLVLGVQNSDEDYCYLQIERIGDPEITIEDYPWVIYEATVELGAFTMGENVTLHEFDLTAAEYTLVLNENDGFYHLNTADGPLVYAKLGAKSEYLDSIQTVLDCSGIVKYFYDDDGNFVEKVSYSQCLLEYIACMDEDTGLYPLTEDLAYIFQQRGEFVGWWDIDGHSYLFVDKNRNPIPGINPDVAWLFLCCYGTVEEIQDQPTQPPVEPTEPPATEHTHSYRVTDIVKPGCTTDGYSVYTCDCGDSYSGDAAKATGHSFGDWVETKAPTETTTGEKTRTCANCGEKETAEIPVLTPEHSHSYTAKVTKEPTCAAAGETTYTCSCGDFYTESIEKLTTHSYKSKVTDPTCGSVGFTTYTCSVCGDQYTADETAKLSHTWGQWTLSKEGTADTNAEASRACTVCGGNEVCNLGKAWSSDPEVRYFSEEYTVSVKAGEYNVYYFNRIVSTMCLSVKSDDAYVICNGVVYFAKNGSVDIEFSSDGATSIVPIYIGNSGSSDAEFTVKMGSPLGSQSNPEKLSLGSFTTELEAGNEVGYYYTYTATASGTLTVTVNSVTEGTACGISLYNLNTYAYRTMDVDGDGTTVTIEVNAGDVIQVTVAAVPENFEYPATTVKATASIS